MMRQIFQQNFKKNQKNISSSVSAQAPGKLIIIGEHAVLYGRKAFIQTISLWTNCQLDYFFVNKNSFFYISIINNRQIQDYVLARESSSEQYSTVLHNKLLAFILKTYDQIIPKNISLKIQIESSIPQDRGMGSSAALIVSLIEAFNLKFNMGYSFEDKFLLAKKFEDIQHGQSSGADLIASFKGGLNIFKNGQQISHQLNIPSNSYYLVDSGRKTTPTKQAVEHVKSIWNTKIELEFIMLENDVIDALFSQDINKFYDCIKKNHHLLIKLGIVPLKVQKFIRKIEQAGGAAKISGSGAISGNAAGAVIVFGCDHLNEYCEEFEYQFKNVKGEDRGVKIY